MHEFKPCDLVAGCSEKRFDLPYFVPGYIYIQPNTPGLLSVGRRAEDALGEVVGNLFNRQFVQDDSFRVYFPSSRSGDDLTLDWC